LHVTRARGNAGADHPLGWYEVDEVEDELLAGVRDAEEVRVAPLELLVRDLDAHALLRIFLIGHGRAPPGGSWGWRDRTARRCSARARRRSAFAAGLLPARAPVEPPAVTRPVDADRRGGGRHREREHLLAIVVGRTVARMDGGVHHELAGGE